MNRTYYRLVTQTEYDKIKGIMSGSGVDSTQEKIEKIIEMINPIQRSKCKRILSILLEGRNFILVTTTQWSYMGNVVRNSNIIDLLSAATRSVPLKSLDYPGIDLFLDALLNEHVPQELLSIQFRTLITGKQDTLDQSSSEKSRWKNFQFKK